jgi:hypothetical protein
MPENRSGYKICGIKWKEISDSELLDVADGTILEHTVKTWCCFLSLRLRNGGENL